MKRTERTWAVEGNGAGFLPEHRWVRVQAAEYHGGEATVAVLYEGDPQAVRVVHIGLAGLHELSEDAAEAVAQVETRLQTYIEREVADYIEPGKHGEWLAAEREKLILEREGETDRDDRLMPAPSDPDVGRCIVAGCTNWSEDTMCAAHAPDAGQIAENEAIERERIRLNAGDAETTNGGW